MRNLYQEQLWNLNQELIQMGAACEEIIALDKLDPEQMKLNYLANAVRQEDNSPYYDKMVRYVQDLREAGTYFSCTGLSGKGSIHRLCLKCQSKSRPGFILLCTGNREQER